MKTPKADDVELKSGKVDKLSSFSIRDMFASLFSGTSRQLMFNHKTLVKSGITAHKPRPGRHSKVVAKGFNPETNSWS